MDTSTVRIRTLTRRQLIQTGAAAAIGAVAAPASLIAGPRDRSELPRSLAFFALHTGEHLKTTYWSDGEYLAPALDNINYLLRDHRANEVKSIDVSLLNLLERLHRQLDTRQPFHVISGYRTAATNAILNARSEGVARHSLHMEGMAIDIRVPDRRLPTLRRAATALHGGGVGYYPRSDFVHVDVGRVRYW
jgi:uncharacterized protein YcbK (DUF882 family)